MPAIAKYVVSAEHLEEYKVLLHFSDGVLKVIDFEHFFSEHPHPQYNAYRDKAEFKKFRIENGNLVWGKDWDLIFPVEQLYFGMI